MNRGSPPCISVGHSGSISTTETSFPCALRKSADSIPVIPPPITTIFLSSYFPPSRHLNIHALVGGTDCNIADIDAPGLIDGINDIVGQIIGSRLPILSNFLGHFKSPGSFVLFDCGIRLLSPAGLRKPHESCTSVLQADLFLSRAQARFPAAFLFSSLTEGYTLQYPTGFR